MDSMKDKIHLIIFIAALSPFLLLACSNSTTSSQDKSKEIQDIYHRINNDIVAYYQSNKDSTILIADLMTLDSLGESIYENQLLVQLKMTIYSELGKKSEALNFLSTVPDSVLTTRTTMNGKTYTTDGKIVRAMSEGFFANSETERMNKYNIAATMLEDYLSHNIDENAIINYIVVKCNIDSTCDVDKLIDDFKKDGKYDNQFLDNLKSIDWDSEMAAISKEQTQ